MKANNRKVETLLENHFDGNYTKFAQVLDVDTSHLHRFINTGVGGGKKIVGAIIKFCKNEGLNFEDYIDL